MILFKLNFSKGYFRDKLIIFPLLISLGLDAAFCLALWLRMRGIKETLPLHYNVLSGVDLIGHWTNFLKLPLISVIVLIVNGILAFYLWQKANKILAYFLSFTVLLVTLALSLAGYLIINL